MSIYHFNGASVIDEVTFRKTANGSIRAYLHARSGNNAQAVEPIKQALTNNGFQWTPSTLNSQESVLEVRKIKSEAKLIKFLRKNNWISGKPGIELEKEDNITWGEWFKKRTLQASGMAYLIGDWGFWTYNRKEADTLGMAGAVSYFLGTLALVFYGRNDQSDLQVHGFAKDIKHFLETEKIKPSEDTALHEITQEKKKGLFQSLNEFGKRYPSEIFNSVTALAGVFVASSAYKKVLKANKKAGGAFLMTDDRARRALRNEGWKDVGLGVATALSGTLATVVKEKKPDPDDPAKKGLAWIWGKIRAHPLAIAGGGYTISTMFHAWSTFDAYKEAKRVNDQDRLSSVPRRALFVGMALLSEFLLAISSKGHGEGVVSDTSVDESAIAIAADFITHQPREKQDELIAKLGKFLGDHRELAMDDAMVLETLRQQVEIMRNSPWAQSAGTKNEQPAALAPAEKQASVIPAPAQAETSLWQAKMAAKEAATPQTQLSA